ncbi:pyruvate dehydrogenase complex dihydrolipoamide acetyltransferase [Sulfitobacter mediterraneus]|uniref:pyruvate dehydrogenase complex dihydrolipoamide acetyltransferase n=1 Tax=Sulfitobacter mediterraneus TaxID=83219 RepID=UPI00193258D3|nr:pyruvate dehydrogenase complex dihydrolipoamide acetyltransferase [Sulfitobacter mediterraneus]MBM1631775.1 pyruvate dehydrogenase complex dihydrolipoamide acetyltransferase [Sulfitobacter mediterraneus]MBM1639590.1 pyruvate dehydrogenase complex dihydrolipoamide acetyltransferase [Sulfitobacter mediterraneus]MBM1643639.1 pyruvate dehydrogenase complex dihydrolipoamide acetyltransferase [Sulfitobacter mediterraneus]MBM1647685.1 pyruvate dehydrogenase complex dihydrolipoamide acetyltransferas
MPTEILMPALSPTMEEGTLAKWLVKEGDTVSSGDLLAEIETDKATMEFEAVDEGVIGQILIPEGSEGVKVNTAIAVLLEDGESADDIGSAAPAPKAEAEPSATPDAAPAATAAPAAAAPAPAAPKGADGTRIFASPLARRIAANKGLDLANVTGSGPHGRIVKSDVEGLSASDAPAAKPAADAAAPAAPAAAAQGPSTDAVLKIYEGREFEEVKLDGMRKTIAARLTEAKQSIPHFYLRRDIQLDALMNFRADLNKQLEPRGIKLSVNDFIIKACALALQQVPEANSVWAGDRTLRLKPSDVAVAVAIEGGLFTPVLKDAEMKSLSALSAEMKDLAARARDRKLAPHEYQGGSFAISNLGMFGIENFDAVINPPHGAILAVGAGVKKPIVGKDGEMAVATVMSVTLSVDHRVIDGALGANLLNAIKDNLEAPMTMLA